MLQLNLLLPDACSAQTATEDSGQAARRTTVVRKLQLLNLPKLLDVCSLYGADNPQLVQRLAAEVLANEPGYPFAPSMTRRLGCVQAINEATRTVVLQLLAQCCDEWAKLIAGLQLIRMLPARASPQESCEAKVWTV